MSIEEVEALSFLMTLKNAIMDLPYVTKTTQKHFDNLKYFFFLQGGAKGGLQINRRDYSAREL